MHFIHEPLAGSLRTADAFPVVASRRPEMSLLLEGYWLAMLLLPIGQLHDDIILIQLPESSSLLFSCAN